MGVFPVVGGGDAPVGAWPDVAALRDTQGKLLCTGTLIAARLVITAGHCDRTDLADVLIGGVPLDHPELGEVIGIASKIAYANAETSEDVSLIVLATPSTHAPRAIASGWDLANGVAATLVGYGATDSAGTVFVPTLQQATTAITDFGCSTVAGCNAGALPFGELGAGGTGVDTCVGDSGGPLYVGGTLAGVTSRGYTGETALCGMGSIYARADALILFIEASSGQQVVAGAAPTADPISTTRGTLGTTTILPNAPAGIGELAYAIATPPTGVTAAVTADGIVKVCPDASFTDDTDVTVAITDGAHGVSLAIPIHVANGPPAATACTLDEGAGGCCSAGRSAGGSLPLALGTFAALRRRRGC